MPLGAEIFEVQMVPFSKYKWCSVLCLSGVPGGTLKYFKVALDPRSKIQDSKKNFWNLGSWILDPGPL